MKDILKRVLTSKAVGRLAAVFILLIIASALMRERLEAVGSWFTSHFGATGMAVGSFLADAFHFPIPPQFYLLAAVMSNASHFVAFLAICAGSVAGGFTAYWLARHFSNKAFVRRWFVHDAEAMTELLARYGGRAVLVGSVSPIPFSTLCVVAGLYKVSHRLLFVLLVLRIPRLVFFYFIIRAGWSLAVTS